MHAHVNGGRQRAHDVCEPAGPRSVRETLSASTDEERA